MGAALTSRLSTFGRWPAVDMRGYPTVELMLWAQQVEARTGGAEADVSVGDLAIMPVAPVVTFSVDLAPVAVGADVSADLAPVGILATPTNNLEPV